MARSKTPSFIFEQKLLTSRQDERVLDLRFRCVWHIKLQLVKHARRQISKYLDDPYRKTLVSERSCLLGKNGRLSVKRRTEISHALNDIRLSYGLSQYQFKLWVKPLQHRYKKHIDSRTAQSISGIYRCSVQVTRHLKEPMRKKHCPIGSGTAVS